MSEDVNYAMISSRSVNPESYYSVMSDINPAFVELADRLAIVRRRLQMIEEVSRWSSHSRALDNETTKHGINDICWRARLLVSIDLVVTGVEELFSDVDSGSAADTEVSSYMDIFSSLVSTSGFALRA